MKKILTALLLVLIAFAGTACAGPTIADNYISIVPQSCDLFTVGGAAEPVESDDLLPADALKDVIKNYPSYCAPLGNVEIQSLFGFWLDDGAASFEVTGVNMANFETPLTDEQLNKIAALKKAGAVMKIYSVSTAEFADGQMQLIVDNCAYEITSSDIQITTKFNVKSGPDYGVFLVLPKSDSSGGCNVGFGALLAVMALPLAFRKKK
ncbi:MAG: Synerg-CTERM sorting domain-containing protein [Synergistaceae bacterium]|nr:Synerg-CTERM sorting domain-containing protein [Synergistaceae bacterium]